MAMVSERLRLRIERDFPERGNASSVIELVGSISDSERVQAAVVVWGAGNLDRVRDAVELAERDWRDVLARADLADGDWASRLDVELGPS